MELTLYLKFTQHKQLREKLVSTGNAELVEVRESVSFPLFLFLRVFPALTLNITQQNLVFYTELGHRQFLGHRPRRTWTKRIREGFGEVTSVFAR